MKTLKSISILASFSLVLLSTACQKDRVTGNGDFAVAMMDAPADYSHLDVEITKVEVYSSASGWVTLNSQAQTVNILSLTNGRQVALGSKSDIKAGNYTMLRLTFGNRHTLGLTGNSAVALGGLTGAIDVDLAYAGPREVVIAIDQELEAEGSTELLIDFHAAESVVDSANQHYLRPVITQVRDRLTGLRGQVQGSANAMVTAYVNGTTTSVGTYADVEGNFLFRDLSPGIYDVVITPASEMNNVSPDAITVENVTVAQGQIKNMGSFQF